MELSKKLVTTAFCLAVTFLVAYSDNVNVQESLQQYGQQQPLLSLPRKLKLLEVANRSAYNGIMLQKRLLEEGSAGEKRIEKEEEVMTTKRGTWREWVESPNKSEYFTMDYSWVRRRRPIHNKQIPLIP